jgi:hypothetical protein
MPAKAFNPSSSGAPRCFMGGDYGRDGAFGKAPGGTLNPNGATDD